MCARRPITISRRDGAVQGIFVATAAAIPCCNKAPPAIAEQPLPKVTTTVVVQQ